MMKALELKTTPVFLVFLAAIQMYLARDTQPISFLPYSFKISAAVGFLAIAGLFLCGRVWAFIRNNDHG
jgi:hypothetical protein